MREIISCIEIGSSTIKLIVCESYESDIHVLASETISSSGVVQGLVFDADKCVVEIKKLITTVNKKLGIKINKVLALIPEHNTLFKIVKETGVIAKDEFGNDSRIDGADIVNILNKSYENKIEEDYKFITIVPFAFAVDDKYITIDPKTISGSKLTIHSVVVQAPTKNLYSVIGVLEKADLKVIDVGISSIGDYLVSKSNSGNNTLLINIGHEITTVSAFNRGIIINNEIIKIGAINIENDIMYVYNVDRQVATSLKEKFAFAIKDLAGSSEYTKVINNDGEEISISRQELSEIVNLRIVEILNVSKEHAIHLINKPIDNYAVTGGITELRSFDKLLTDYSYDFKRININKIGVRNNTYSGVYGNVKFFYNKLKLRDKKYSSFDEEDINDMSRITKKQKTEESDKSVVKNVFNYFFDNK